MSEKPQLPHRPEETPLAHQVRAALAQMAREAPAPPSVDVVLARLREPRVVRPRVRQRLVAAAAVALGAAAVTLAVLALDNGDRPAQPAREWVRTAVELPRHEQPEEAVAPDAATLEQPRQPEPSDPPAAAQVEPIAADAPSMHAMAVLSRWIESTGASVAIIDARPGRPVALALCGAPPNPARNYDAELQILLAHYNIVELHYQAGRLTGTLGRVRIPPQP